MKVSNLCLILSVVLLLVSSFKTRFHTVEPHMYYLFKGRIILEFMDDTECLFINDVFEFTETIDGFVAVSELGVQTSHIAHLVQITLLTFLVFVGVTVPFKEIEVEVRIVL